MHLTIIAVGSQGDVQPYVALGAELKSAGHHVQVATLSNFKDFVLNCGLGFAEVKGNPREWLETDQGLAWLESGPNMIGFYRGLKRFMEPVLESLLPTSYAACAHSDAILYSSLAFSGPHIAEKLRCLSFPVMLQPVYPTAEFPAVLVNTDKKTGPSFNRFSHFITDQILHHSSRTSINRWRRQALGLSPTPWLGIYRDLRHKRVPQFLGYSESVVPRPADWPDHVHVTGYWFLKQTTQWEPPADLLEFLAKGSPPVYIGFGSMTTRRPAELTALITRALDLAGERGILLGGWSGLGADSLPETIYRANSIPHEWLFPRMAAVVHHGGAGTTAASLRAGVPSIITPFFADQFFWARRVAELGAGPRYIPHARLTAENLASAIKIATTDPMISLRANTLAKKIRAENGAAKMVSIFEQAIRRHSHPSLSVPRVPTHLETIERTVIASLEQKITEGTKS